MADSAGDAGNGTDDGSDEVTDDGSDEVTDDGSDEEEAFLFEPVALWTFEGMGRPTMIEDRVGNVHLFPFPVAPADEAVSVINNALVLAGGNLKSDLDPGTALIAPLQGRKEFSAEIWAEMSAGDFEGKRIVFKPTGSDLFNFNQFTTGASFEVPVQSAGDGAVVVMDHRAELHHWVGTFSAEGKFVRLYLDGDLASSATLIDPITFANKEDSRVEIGDQAWRGRVYLAAIYNRALAPLDIRTLHEAGWQR
jgi:hypothetical protein